MEARFEDAGGGARLVNPLGGDVTFKVRGDATDGRLTVFDTIVAPGEGPPLHVHASEEETLYVLEGRARFKLGDEIRSGEAGSFAFVPRGQPHTFQNIGDAPLRMLIHFAPSGMERFFEAFASLDEPGPEAFERAAAPAGMTVVGPPLAVSDPLG